MSAAGHKKRVNFRNVLTAMIVVVLTAIYVVGFFLLWDYLNVNDRLDDIMDHDFYGKDYSPASPTAVDITVAGKQITVEEELLLSEYFRYYYAGLGARSAENIARFYTNQCEFELFDNLAYDYEIFLLNECPLDLSFDECSLTINIRRRHSVPRSEKIEIDLELSAFMTPKGTGRQMTVREESHSFTVDESGKSPLILIHTADRTVNKTADIMLDSVLSDNRLSRSDLSYTYFSKYISAALSALKTRRKALVLTGADGYACPGPEYEYDRSAAANTALNGFDSDGFFIAYDENDANYVSRCIFASGIPMDSQGDGGDQWKWYDEEISTERKKTGCSKSWFDREAFFTYVTTNTGFGLVGCETASGSGMTGDVVQIMRDGSPIAEFMITAVMERSDGTAADYLVSNDRYSSVPLLSFGSTDIRVLHIAGYNTANI